MTTPSLRFFVRGLLLAALFVILLIPTAFAQEKPPPRFGFGFNGMLSTVDGFGLGFRGRIAAPINTDLSAALDLGLTGFILGGRDDATYVFDPQVSMIVTLPFRGNEAPYLLGGVGAYLAFEDEDSDENADGGPTIHLGFGRVQQLNATTIFYEINPALIVGETAVDLVLPFRIGVIL